MSNVWAHACSASVSDARAAVHVEPKFLKLAHHPPLSQDRKWSKHKLLKAFYPSVLIDQTSMRLAAATLPSKWAPTYSYAAHPLWIKEMLSIKPAAPSERLNKHDIGRGPVPLKLSPYFHLIIATMQGLDGLDREERKWGVEAQGHQADA